MEILQIVYLGYLALLAAPCMEAYSSWGIFTLGPQSVWAVLNITQKYQRVPKKVSAIIQTGGKSQLHWAAPTRRLMGWSKSEESIHLQTITNILNVFTIN